MNSNSLISVIVNCYNGEKFIKKCINSILNQTYTNFEIIFWDNKSSDKSLSIIQQFNDKRLKVFNSTNHTNLSTARNYALNESKGEYICFLDVDDYWDEKKLEIQIKCFNNNIGLSFSNFWYIKTYENRKTIQKIDLKFNEGFINKVIKKYEIVISTIMFKNDLLKNFGIQFNEKYHIIGDFDFLLKLSLITEVNHVKDHLTYRSWHGENESIKKREQAVFEIENWVKENNKNFENYQSEINFLNIKIFNDKLNFKIKKKEFIKAIIFFVKSGANYKLNYTKYIFFRLINKGMLGKIK